MIADNRIAQNAGWDRGILAAEVEELSSLLLEIDLDITVTGFDVGEVDALLLDHEENARDPADEADPEWSKGAPVSQHGDLWILGGHRLLCGDARQGEAFERLTSGEQAAMAFLDPPYNVKIATVVGRGRTKHPEFAMASGEMSSTEFVEFLRCTASNAARVSTAGAVHYICMDWRHLGELFGAAGGVYAAMLNLVVWVKSNAGQGSFYRSQHELIAVYRVGDAAHRNNVELGRFGRNRSNTWHYAGVNSTRPGRINELKLHPTVKPIALVADAIKDCTRRDDLVLDCFSGSGTTIMAAERVGRRAAAMEFTPNYVDVALRRWMAFTGRDAVHSETGKTFEEVAVERVTDPKRPGLGKAPSTTQGGER